MIRPETDTEKEVRLQRLALWQAVLGQLEVVEKTLRPHLDEDDPNRKAAHDGQR